MVRDTSLTKAQKNKLYGYIHPAAIITSIDTVNLGRPSDVDEMDVDIWNDYLLSRTKEPKNHYAWLVDLAVFNCKWRPPSGRFHSQEHSNSLRNIMLPERQLRGGCKRCGLFCTPPGNSACQPRSLFRSIRSDAGRTRKLSGNRRGEVRVCAPSPAVTHAAHWIPREGE